MRFLVAWGAVAAVWAGCSDNGGAWEVVDGPAASGVNLVFAQSLGEEIWVSGWRDGDVEPTLVHYDGAMWSRPEAELTRPVTVAGHHSFWTNRITDDSRTELLHSTDLVNWTRIDLAGDTGLPISAAEILFADGESVWVLAYTASETILLHTRGSDWMDVTPPRLAGIGVVGIGGCRRADDDVWVTATWDSFDDNFPDGWFGHWDGGTWADADIPGSIISCRSGELFAASVEPLSLSPGERIYRQNAGTWTEVEFAEEWRVVSDEAPAGAAGELWLLGWSQDLTARRAIPRIWRVDGDRARDTLGGDLGVEALKPRLNGVGALHAIATTDGGATFAFGEDGLILEYLDH